MTKKLIALLLCAALLGALAGCGSPRGDTAASAPSPAGAAPESVPSVSEAPAPEGAALPDPPQNRALSFPLLPAPFSDAETDEMINHNARRCALMSGTAFYCCRLYSDGSRALVRFEIIDNKLRDRSLLVPDCGADFLSEHGGRLYYLGADGRPESVKTDGTDRRVELDTPCLSLQLYGGALYCLTADGLLLALRGGEEEALLAGCASAFVSGSGIFYTAASDGRAHLFDPEARTDVTLTASAADTLTVVGTELWYASSEPDGRHICALDLASGAERRMAEPFSGTADFFRGWDGICRLRLTAADGQRVIACAQVFDTPLSGWEKASGERRLTRALNDPLRSEELLAPDGTALGFELIMPGGASERSLAADNPPEK
ncbi:MAG: hypothetical protein IJP64_05985 [Oscillospiraceae bacterium]|nr:hypothetical protein [Oscillospiraceae bacterium]